MAALAGFRQNLTRILCSGGFFMLRQQYTSLLRRFFSREIGKYRVRCKLTQEQIAERLCMAVRSYVYLEQGLSGCSGLTVVLFFLLLKEEEVLALLDVIRKELEEAGKHDAA